MRVYFYLLILVLLTFCQHKSLIVDPSSGVQHIDGSGSNTSFSGDKVEALPKNSGHFSMTASVRTPASLPATSLENAFITPLKGEVRQLTFQGNRSGEGYFSSDGTKMIFQSERQTGNPFYQIYLKDLESGDIKRLSNGNGKTTCSWLHPNGHKALFSSTHLDPHWKEKAKQEMEIRKSGKPAPYSWSYDEYYDIFEVNLKNGKLKPLTLTPGYDAEASYSPEGNEIVFASNRQAYVGENFASILEKREKDPSYFMDLYLMDANGKNVRRLTTMNGYDGGPFFSSDGKKIVWRHFAEDGRTAEIWSMNRDGSDQKQLTKLNVMSWAPYYHPSGEYIVFTSSLYGHDNFELFIVDSNGTHAPVRVTQSSGFDGLPVFTPDGQHLSWTKRNQKGDSQIYLSAWDDGLARKLLGLPVDKNITYPFPPRASITESELKFWVRHLSDEKMSGRETGSKEEQIYQTAIGNYFKKEGLTPFFPKGFLSRYAFVEGIHMGPKNHVELLLDKKTFTLSLNQDWIPLLSSNVGSFQGQEWVFAGYGINATPSINGYSYNSYQKLNVKNKWVIVFEDMPANLTNEQRFHLNFFSRTQNKAIAARQAGASGIIIIGSQLSNHSQSGAVADVGIPVVQFTSAVAEKIFSPFFNLVDSRKILDQGEFVDFSGAMKISGQVDLETTHKSASNVVAFIKVPGAKSTLLIGAHGDHLGHGNQGQSLASTTEHGKVHYGADDNASGVASVLELAQYFSRKNREGSLHFKYNLAFAVWSGEEMGLLGANAFLKAPEVKNIVGYVNLDMVGRLNNKLYIQGVGSAEQWSGYIEPVAVKHDLPIALSSDPYLPTDALSFYLKEIPVISFFTGAHAEYHTPRDTSDTINYAGLLETTRFVSHLVEQIASPKSAGLTYKKVEGNYSPNEGRGFRLYIGTIPDYSQGEVSGVRISGTKKESPAEKAGLRSGDIIIQLGGIPIRNLQDYVYCLQSIKANEMTNIKVNRAGQMVELKITPTLKGL
ncbi:MAG: M28 family peptidase [Bdellovibrionales bacterium]|nr:M28 family peptidase [Bdellovibrionales bacterium]